MSTSNADQHKKDGTPRRRRSKAPGVASAPSESDWLGEIAERVTPTKTSALILQWLASQPEQASRITASALAAEIGVTPATIVRFAQSAGFKGWPDFQSSFRHRYLGTLSPSAMDEALGVEASPATAALAQDRRNLEFLRAGIDEARLLSVVKHMAEGRTLVASSGSYVAVGEILAVNAKILGYNVGMEYRGGSHLAAELIDLRPGDTFIAISFWRLNKQIVQATTWARERGIHTVAITDSMFSPLAVAADEVLTAPTESVGFFQSMTGAVSLVYAVLALLHNVAGDQAVERLRSATHVYDALDLLHPQAPLPSQMDRRPARS